MKDFNQFTKRGSVSKGDMKNDLRRPFFFLSVLYLLEGWQNCEVAILYHKELNLELEVFLSRFLIHMKEIRETTNT